MFIHSESGKLDGVCTTVMCQYIKIKPKATHLNMDEGKWVCFPCAQRINGATLAKYTKYGAVHNYKRPCISGKEYMLKVLMNE